MKDKKPEIESLNIDDIDLQELEQRLELAACAAADCDCCGKSCKKHIS